MDSMLILVIATIIILFILFLLVFAFREQITVQPTEDRLLLRHPFRKRYIALDKELVSWKLQEAQYIRWGKVYAINMLFRDGKRLAVGSRFNPDNYEKLYHHLSSNYASKREADR